MVETKNIQQLLSEVPFFEGMDDKYLELIAGCGKIMHFRAGDFLIREDGVADTFYLIRKGDAAIESYVPSTGPLSIARIGAGDIAGYSWLFPPYRNHFDVHALTDISAIALDGKCLRGKAEDDHAFGYQLMKRFTQIALDRMQKTRRQAMDIYTAERATDVSAGNG